MSKTGVAPAASGEIAIDRGLADDEDLAVGDNVIVLTLAGQQDATIVGITSFGSSDAQDQSGTVSISEADAFDWLNSGQVEYQDLYLRGNVGEQELVDAVEPLVPDGFKIQTGQDFLEDKRNEVGGFGKVLKSALQFFALLALFVGGFVIYNTFNVIVAQRLRELAVLAAIGATPKQLKRSLRFEGLVIGLIGSALGVAAGFALAFGLMAILSADRCVAAGQWDRRQSAGRHPRHRPGHVDHAVVGDDPGPARGAHGADRSAA